MSMIDSVQKTADTVNDGLAHVMSNDNIAIVVLMVALCFSGAFNILQFWDARKVRNERREDTDKLLDLAMGKGETDHQIINLLTLIEDRVGHKQKKPGAVVAEEART